MIFFLSNSRFQKCVPKPWKLYEMRLPGESNEMIMSVVYYISDKRLTLLEFQREAMTLPAYVETLWDFSESEMTVLFVNSTIPRKGFATLLLSAAIITAGEEGIEKVLLDDDSDNYQKKNNIYLKLGLRYVSDDGPEMEGSTKTVSRKWRTIRQKYNWDC